jgi:hypothetical protein
MAIHAALEPRLTMADIPEDMKKSFNVRETENEFLVRTFSGSTLHYPKSGIHYWWQLLSGVWDSGMDTTEQRNRERELERTLDGRKLGADFS